MIYVIIILAIVALIFIARLFKVPKTDCVTLVTGGIKTGKSMLSVYLACRNWKLRHFKWKLDCFFVKFINIFKKKDKKLSFKEEPLLYSNVKLAGIPFVFLDEDLLLRKKRFNFGSVIYIQEASLVADSMSFDDKYTNESLLLFNKLIGHETHGGALFYDTQSIKDNHYAVKRCLSSYIYINHAFNIPFFRILAVRELKYSDDGDSVNTFASDIEDSLQFVIVPKSVWKYYDAYTFSCFTDDLERVEDKKLYKPAKYCHRLQLKTNKIVSFKKFLTLKRCSDENGIKKVK